MSVWTRLYIWRLRFVSWQGFVLPHGSFSRFLWFFDVMWFFSNLGKIMLPASIDIWDFTYYLLEFKSWWGYRHGPDGRRIAPTCIWKGGARGRWQAWKSSTGELEQLGEEIKEGMGRVSGSYTYNEMIFGTEKETRLLYGLPIILICCYTCLAWLIAAGWPEYTMYEHVYLVCTFGVDGSVIKTRGV